ncbi:MAG: hypothetical protein ACE5IL_13750 [Myxococcota bacterium]
MAEVFRFREQGWRSDLFRCACGWEGRTDEMAIDCATDVSDYSCPRCDCMLVIVGHPTLDELLSDPSSDPEGAPGRASGTRGR